MLFDKYFSKRLKQEVKRVTIYISENHHQIIFAPLHKNAAGIYYEQDASFAYDFPISESDLGDYATRYLNLFIIQDKNLRDLKISDWPAFKISKAKSIRNFESDYIRMSIYGANESNITLIVEGHPYKDSDLLVSSTISAYAERIEIGERIIRVYKACLTGSLTG